MEKAHQIELSKILDIETGLHGKKEPATWAEIYVAIGKLKERAEKNIINVPHYESMPFINKDNPNLHYHNGMPCYNNPCVWCGK